MKLDTALYQLRTQPNAFLQTSLLNLVGSPSGVKNAYFYRFAESVGVNEAFSINPYMSFVAADDVGGLDGKVVTRVAVRSVRMIPRTEGIDFSTIEPYTLDGGGPDIMITGQLNACIFVVQQVGGQLHVAHIQPGGALQTAAVLRQTLKLTGRFAGQGRVTHVFGKGDYASYAYVVGVRSGGIWHVYGQRTAGPGGPVVGVTQIV